MRVFHSIVALVVLALGLPSAAAPLNLTAGYPDIFSPNVSVSYNSGTQVFSAVDVTSGMFAVDLGGLPGPEYYIAGGATFTLTAFIDNTGTLLPGGTIAISGAALIDSGFNFVSPGPSLTGKLTAFGFPGGVGNIFEFLFDVTGGTLVAPPIAFGMQGGVILNAIGSGFNFADNAHNFNSNFATPGVGTADTFGAAIPTPAAAYGGLALLLGLVAYRTRAKLRA
jgi:hypothetical protein